MLKKCCALSSVLVAASLAFLPGCGGGGGNNGGGPPPPITVSLSPASGTLDASQTLQFHVNVTGDSANRGVTWTVDTVAGGNATVGSITSGGVYTPPFSRGPHTIAATSVADTSKSASASITVYLPGVYTYHNNLARDGANIRETALTAATVNQAAFGKLFSCPVDGVAYAQPLWIPTLDIGGGTRNVIFVATQHDTVYAFDADANPCAQLWRINLLDAAHGASAGETTVPTADVGAGFQDIIPEIGVTGTPVIDPVSNVMYLVSKSEGPTGTFHQRLHALDLITGDEKFTGPVDIAASVAGTGDGTVGGTVAFDLKMEHQRSALALVNGVVYVAWAAHEDARPYHGWMIGYNAATLRRTGFFNTTPDGGLGGIWMAGGAPAADSSGNLYASTGNGTFNASNTSGPHADFGDTVLKFNSALSVADWFTPFNQAMLAAVDADLASGGVVVLPDQQSGTSRLLVSVGKQGIAYLLNRDSMGHFCATCVGATGDTNTVQSFSLGHAIFGTPAFWQNGLYTGGTSDNIALYAFNPSTGRFNTSAASRSVGSFFFPGATPSISSNGAAGGIAWAIDTSAYGFPSSHGQGPAVLHAYDATNLANELWNSAQASGNRDQAGNAAKFAVPTVINGKVYIGTRTEIDVYGLF